MKKIINIFLLLLITLAVSAQNPRWPNRWMKDHLDDITNMSAAARDSLGDLTATELEILDDATVTTTELNLLGGMNNAALDSLADLSAAEVDILDDATVTTAELNLLGGMNNAALDSLADLSAAEVDILDDATVTTAELNLLGGMNNAALDSLADLTAAELELLDGATTTMSLAALEATSITFDSAGVITNANSDTLRITETAVSVHGALHVTGAITADGACCGADYAINDEQPPLDEYWQKTQELSHLPAFENVDRRNLVNYIVGLEESNERLLRYVVDMEARIKELEARLIE